MNLGENPTLTEEVEPDNELKTWLVDYVGDKSKPEDGQVTVENIVEVIANEFPEFLMVVAEENWIRGYHQALIDVEEGKKMYEREQAREAVTAEGEVEEVQEETEEECETCTGECEQCEQLYQREFKILSRETPI